MCKALSLFKTSTDIVVCSTLETENACKTHNFFEIYLRSSFIFTLDYGTVSCRRLVI